MGPTSKGREGKGKEREPGLRGEGEVREREGCVIAVGGWTPLMK